MDGLKAAQEALWDEPVKPVAKKPVAKKPVAKKPVAKKPVAKKAVKETMVLIQVPRKVIVDSIQDHITMWIEDNYSPAAVKAVVTPAMIAAHAERLVPQVAAAAGQIIKDSFIENDLLEYLDVDVLYDTIQNEVGPLLKLVNAEEERLETIYELEAALKDMEEDLVRLGYKIVRPAKNAKK